MLTSRARTRKSFAVAGLKQWLGLRTSDSHPQLWTAHAERRACRDIIGAAQRPGVHKGCCVGP